MDVETKVEVLMDGIYIPSASPDESLGLTFGRRKAINAAIWVINGASVVSHGMAAMAAVSCNYSAP
jgi:hypothetical protein